ncbi:cytochrome-c peroxidase [Aquimarina agarivorans]|uniref:cytochrome-c peroxidase n=1 Tax=Aquimarina agarivorans TaxID=980584 RepID=UPI000248F929|nr:cytochrome c peroxidase [Aquimarina agarivorans]
MMGFVEYLKYVALVLCIAGCKKQHSFTLIAKKEAVYLPLPLKVKAPVDNQMTEEKIALGKLLFFDPILSGEKNVACATCHHPKNGYAEFRDLSIGVNGKGFGAHRKIVKMDSILSFVKRNAHTILNTAFNGISETGQVSAKKAPMFWDNRVESLEAQALEPIKSLEEMRGFRIAKKAILDSIVLRLNSNKQYKELFRKAFDNKVIKAIHLGKAIATFERSLITPNSRFDQFLRGNDNALSISEKEGFKIFKRVGCANCHSGPMFSDYKLHTLGMIENEKLAAPDKGAKDQFQFRTPTLRNLQFTAPYMHNGKFNSLKKVLEFYEEIAGKKVKNPNVAAKDLDTLINKVTITAKDINLIESFLNSLNDTNFDKEVPRSVPSKLAVGGDI